jgi:hypothetical protein
VRSRRAAVRSALPAALLASVAILAAGCGSSPTSPAVANATTASPTTTTRSSTGVPSASGILAGEEAYARCMRGHGIPDFPDPTPGSHGGGGFDITAGPGSDLNQNLPKYQAANRACEALLPGGSRTPAQLAQAVAAGIKLANRVRSHGFPNFPDPNNQDNFNMNGINQNSALFQKDFKSCGGLAGASGASFSSRSAANGSSSARK